MSKKKVGIIIGVIAAALVAAGVGFYFLRGKEQWWKFGRQGICRKSICNHEPVSRSQ